MSAILAHGYWEDLFFVRLYAVRGRKLQVLYRYTSKIIIKRCWWNYSKERCREGGHCVDNDHLMLFFFFFEKFPLFLRCGILEFFHLPEWAQHCNDSCVFQGVWSLRIFMGRKVSFCQLRFRRRDKKITVGGRELLPELNLIDYFINYFWGCPLAN